MSFFSKMCRVSQASLMGLSLDGYSKRLPKSGTMRSGVIYEQKMSARLMPANAGSVSAGAWPTPVNSDDQHRQPGTPHLTSNGNIRHRSASGETYFMRLSQVVKLWSTPRSSMNRDDQGSGEIVDGRLHRGGNIYGLALPTQVKQWGTPTATVAKRTGPEGSKSHAHSIKREHLKAQIVDGSATAINPAWELLLMGYPADWLDIDGPPDRAANSTTSSRRVYSRRRHRTGKTKYAPLVTPSYPNVSTRLPLRSASFYRASMLKKG